MSSEGTNQVWGYHKFGGSINDYALETLPKPVIEASRPYDVLVRNYAAGLNPTDENKRGGLYGNKGVSAEVVIGGYDGSGVIEAVGPQVKNFRVGDQVWYAGDATRHGSFAQYTLVDSRIISLKPKTLSHEEAAALPLTAITVWEGVKEKLNPVPGKDILIVAGAGGVGSIAIQLCKFWGLRVTATASRPETSEWCVKLGADFIIDHTKKYADELQKLAEREAGKGSIKGFDYVLLASNDSHLAEVVSVLNPRGHIVFILPFYKDNTNEIMQILLKSASLHFEYMSSRPSFGYDEQKQGDILAEVTKLVDAGTIKSTLNQTFEWADFLKAQQLLVSGKTIGKTALRIS